MVESAGSVVGLASRGEGGAILRHKLDTIGFGFLIPMFFVTSGSKFDLETLLASPSALLRLPVFLLCCLVMRGVPVCLYRREVDKEESHSVCHRFALHNWQVEQFLHNC